MFLPDSLSRVMSLALGYQEGHLLGFYPIFRIEGAADHLDPEDWIPGPSLSKWRPSRGSDLQGFAKPFRKALSKTPQHHGSPPCLNFEGSPPWHGRCATRHPFVRNPDQCARPTRGFPVVRLDVLLVQFGKPGLEVTKAADRAVILVVAPGRVLANTSQQDNLLDALQQNPTLEPASCQDFVGRRERRLYAGPSLEQFLDRGDEGVRGVVEHLLFTLLVRPVSLSHFHHTPAEATMAEPASTNAGGFHLA